MPITKISGVITETSIKDKDQFERTGVVRDDTFAICDNVDRLKQIQFEASPQADQTIATISTNASQVANITITLPATSGTLVTSAAAGNSFSTIQPDFGTSPVATSGADTLTLTSGDASVVITGTAGTDTIDIRTAGAIGLNQLTGDVTAGPGTGSQIATIANSAVTNAKMANMAQSTIKGRAAGAGTGAPVDLSATQATAILNEFTGDAGAGGLKGLVVAPTTGDATKFLRGDATWATVSTQSYGTVQEEGTPLTQRSTLNFIGGLITAADDSGNSRTNVTLSSSVASSANNLSFFAATTSAQLAGVISDETGTGALVFAGSPTFTGTVAGAAASLSGNLSAQSLTLTGNSTSVITVNTNSLVFDATNNALGIGVAPSTTAFIDMVNSTGAAKRIITTGYGTGSITGHRHRFARGTSGSPTAAQSGDNLGFLSAQGYGATGFPAASTGSFNVVAGGNFTDTSMPTYFSWQVTPSASVTLAEAMRLNSTGALLINTTTDDATSKLQVNGATNHLNNDLTKIKTASFNAEVDDSTSGTSKTIDWTTGSAHKISMTGNCTFTFTAPSGPARLQFKLTQDGTGGRTATWPATVKWPTGAPIITSTANAVDIVTFWYDGTNYYAVAAQNFV
jgi:hypothetical protein